MPVRRAGVLWGDGVPLRQHLKSSESQQWLYGIFWCGWGQDEAVQTVGEQA